MTQDGVPVVPFGITTPFFKHNMPKIRHVMVIVAASDAATRDLDKLQTACLGEDELHGVEHVCLHILQVIL